MEQKQPVADETQNQRKAWTKPKLEDMVPLADTSATVPTPVPSPIAV